MTPFHTIPHRPTQYFILVILFTVSHSLHRLQYTKTDHKRNIIAPALLARQVFHTNINLSYNALSWAVSIHAEPFVSTFNKKGSTN